MSNNITDFTLTKLAGKYTFIKDSDLYKFYEKIEEQYKEVDNTKPDDTSIFSEIGNHHVISFLIKLSNLWKDLLKQDFSGDHITKSKVKHCIYLKYWLYDKLIINGFNEYDAKRIFDFLKKNKNGYMTAVISGKTCNFYKLSLKDCYDIKNLYDYSELLYDADKSKYDEISKETEYSSYFKRGNDLYKSSKIKCSLGKKNEYCDEFNEYAKIYRKKSFSLSCKEKLLSSLYKKDTISAEESLQEDVAPSRTLDPNLKTLLEKDKILDKPPLHKFYELLTKEDKKFTSNTCESLQSYLIDNKSDICNIWNSIQKIKEIWNKDYAKPDGLNVYKRCVYLNYWLYHKLQQINANSCDIDAFYFLWHKEAINDSKNEFKCYNEKYYGFSKEQLGNKKLLFDFLEYYKAIRDKLGDVKKENKSDYCQYIKYIFELYKIMDQNNDEQIYTEELMLFKKTFLGNNEIHFLKRECPNMCLDLVFDAKNKKLCPLDEKPSIEDEEEDLMFCENLESFNDNQDILGDHEKVYTFQELPTYDIYKELNDEVMSDNYYNICSKLLKFSKKHCGIYGLCIKLARNLEELYKMKKKERNDRCEYITHWIYDKIRTVLRINTDNTYDAHVLNEFFKVVYNILYKLNIFDCFFNTHNMNLDEQRKKKYLHDYFKNYAKISSWDTYNAHKREIYCGYTKFINKYYAEYIDKCCYCFTSRYCLDECPDYFKCNDTYNPHNIFELLKCNDIEKFQEGLETVNKPLPTDDYVIKLTENSGKTKEITVLKSDSMETSSSPENICNKITCEPFYLAALGAFGFMGFLLLSFMFYKFTPLGSYFHNKDAKKKKIYFQQSEEQFLEDDFEFNHSNMENGRMLLAYHQA